MHVCAPWSDLEIHNLKDLYLSNQPIKIIARMLDRSAPAVNKALSRFGIRMPRGYARPTASFTQNSPSVPPPKTQRRSKLTWDVDMWVKLSDVVDYLRKNGKKITQSTTMQGWHLDHKPIYAHQLLMLANKLRLEKKLPIFLVGDVSC
jgi:hypothetical protein